MKLPVPSRILATLSEHGFNNCNKMEKEYLYMKKNNRALGMVMISMLILNTISVQASDIQTDETDIVSPVQEKAVYSLKYDVAVNDNTLIQELSTFKNDIVEMKFNYDI